MIVDNVNDLAKSLKRLIIAKGGVVHPDLDRIFRADLLCLEPGDLALIIPGEVISKKCYHTQPILANALMIRLPEQGYPHFHTDNNFTLKMGDVVLIEALIPVNTILNISAGTMKEKLDSDVPRVFVAYRLVDDRSNRLCVECNSTYVNFKGL